MYLQRNRRFGSLLVLAAVFAASALAEDSEITPGKADVPYLLHAGSLVEMTGVQAGEEKKKNETTFFVPGTASTVRTPLAGPEFMLLSESLDPNVLRLYSFEVRNGRRQITFNEKKRKQNPVPIIVSVFPVSKGLYKIRVDESLERGEYGLTPDDSNDVFCFAVY
jgi:hypothetical protein